MTATWADEHRVRLSATRFYRNDPIPDIDALDWLIVMGGPMGVGDEGRCPWLLDEKRFLEKALRHDKVVLGICLGAQLIAHVLGAPVKANRHREIGWFPVEKTASAGQSPLSSFLPETMTVLHWHGDTFELPEGSVHLASSRACENQAFSHGSRVIGLQFHLEMTFQGLQRLISHCSDELDDGPYVQTPEEMLSRPGHFEDANSVMRKMLDTLAKSAGH